MDRGRPALSRSITGPQVDAGVPPGRRRQRHSARPREITWSISLPEPRPDHGVGAAEAREVISRLQLGDAHGGRPRRLAVARLDLSLALIGQGEMAEAVESALTAVTSGRVAPSNRWRAREVVRAAERAGTRDAAGLRDAYAEMTGDDG